MTQNSLKTPVPCKFPDCDGIARKREWCEAHYQQWRKTGKVKPKAWALRGTKCVVCGGVVPEGINRRRVCSAACQQIDYRYKGEKRPDSLICALCDKPFSLWRRTENDRLQRTDTKWCPDCGRDSANVQRFRRYGVTPEQYDAATALGCAICGRKDRKLHIDHDHDCCSSMGGNSPTCGACVRGLICGPCNRGLGLFDDNSFSLIRAAEYLTDSHQRTRGQLPLLL